MRKQLPHAAAGTASTQVEAFNRLLQLPEAAVVRGLIRKHEQLESQIKMGCSALAIEADLLESQWRAKFAELADKHHERGLAAWLRNPIPVGRLV